MRIITDNLGMIGAGLAMTLGIALLAYVGALVVGTLIAVCWVSPVKSLTSWRTTPSERRRSALAILLILIPS